MGWEKFPLAWSLGITFVIIGAGVVFLPWMIGIPKGELVVVIATEGAPPN